LQFRKGKEKRDVVTKETKGMRKQRSENEESTDLRAREVGQQTNKMTREASK
jgi:hypothetical protein